MLSNCDESKVQLEKVVDQDNLPGPVSTHTVLKPSNKANIMSSSHFSKKVDHVDVSVSFDATVLKENLGSTKDFDHTSFANDDVDIISFKNSDFIDFSVAEIDLVKTSSQLSRTPLKSVSVSSHDIHGNERKIKNENELSSDSSGKLGDASGNFIPKLEVPSGNVDPFRCKSQLVNSPISLSVSNLKSSSCKTQLAYISNGSVASEVEMLPLKSANSGDADNGSVASEVEILPLKSASSGDADNGSVASEVEMLPLKFANSGDADNGSVTSEVEMLPLNSASSGDAAPSPFQLNTQLLSGLDESNLSKHLEDSHRQITDNSICVRTCKLALCHEMSENNNEKQNLLKPSMLLENSSEKSAKSYSSETSKISAETRDDTEFDHFKEVGHLTSFQENKNTPEEQTPLEPRVQLQNSPEKSEIYKTDKLLKLISEDGNILETTSATQTSDVLLMSATASTEFKAFGDQMGKLDTSGSLDILENVQVFDDPSAWDLLEQFGCGGRSLETNLRRNSLYVKFDPLVRPALSKTPDKNPAPTHSAPRRAVGWQRGALNASVCVGLVTARTICLRPAEIMWQREDESICLMGTPPKVSQCRSVLTQRHMNSSVAQVIIEEETIKPIDKIFSIDEASVEDQCLNDPAVQPKTASAVLVPVDEGAIYTKAQWQQLQQMLVMQYEGQMLARESKLATQLKEKMDTVTQLQEHVGKATADLAFTKSLLAEYERTLTDILAAREKDAEESRLQIDKLKKERDEALEDGQALENSFSELHRRYEKLRQVLEAFKKNEDQLKQFIQGLQDSLEVAKDNAVKIKDKAEEKIAGPSQDDNKYTDTMSDKGYLEEAIMQIAQQMLPELMIVNSMKSKEAEVAQLEAQLRKTKLYVQSLENTLEQKSKEIKELTELCDSLITQVEGRGACR